MIGELAIAQIFLKLLLAGCFADMGYMLLKKRDKLGSAKVGKLKDLGNLRGTDGFKISKNFQLSFHKSCEGVCVIAPPGEGKSAGFFLVNGLENSFPKSSIVFGDLKGELYEKTAAYQRSIGRRVILFEPLGKSSRYNLLMNCNGSFSEIREMASSILSNGELAIQLESGKSSGSAEWVNMAVPLFTACLLMCKSVPEAVDMVIYHSTDELMGLFENTKNLEAAEQFSIFLASGGSEKTMASIKSTLLTNIALYFDKKLQNTLKGNDFTPEQLRKEPIALYVKYSNSSYLAPFLSVFNNQLIKRLLEVKGLPVIVLLDELQNLGRINILPQALATCRYTEMAIAGCLQDMSRMYDIYGENNTISMLNCMKTKCVLPSLSDTKALEYLSKLCGEEEIKVLNHNGETNPAKKNLFTVDEIRRLEDNTMLVIPHNKRPYKDDIDLWFKNQVYKKRVNP